MEAALKIANDLVAELRSKVEAQDQRKAILDKKELEVKVTEDRLREIDVQLTERELETSKVESFLDLRKEAKQAKADAEAARSLLLGDEAAAKQRFDNRMAGLKELENKVATDQAVQRKEYAQLRKDQAQLKVDRDNYKQEVFDKIKAKVGG